MKTKTIKQTVTFKTTPEEVYDALMNSKKHSIFTESNASISTKVNGKIVAYDSYIEGRNEKLTPGKLIVQKWRGSDWPDGHYSLATFKLEKKGKGTKLTFTQKNVPEGQFKSIRKGWKEHYWQKMKKAFDW